jgi:hypothetical protein
MTVLFCAALLTLSFCLPGVAQGTVAKNDILKAVGDTTDYAHVQVIDRLMTVEMSPSLWQSYPGDSRATQMITHFANELMMLAQKMGWGDIWQIIGGTAYQGGPNPEQQSQNPALGQMLGSWKDKMHLTLSMTKQVDGQLVQKTIDNVEMVCNPMEDAQFKPRGNKLFMTITASPSATTYSIKTDPAKTKFDITVPVFQDYSQTFMGQALVKSAQ